MEDQNKRERKRLKPLVGKDQLVSSKKSFGQKFKETFLSEDIDSVKDWLLLDVIIPGMKDIMADTVQMFLFGESYGGRRRNSYRDDYYDYRGSSYYRSKSRRRGRERNRRREDYYSESKADYRNIVLRSKEAAEQIVEELRGRIRSEGSVSIAELFDLVNVAGDYTDNGWGWKHEDEIGIRRVRNGYLIDVCEARYLD